MVEPGWLLSPPGRPYLASILHKNQRRVFGLLERPALPPALSVPTVTYKLFVSGRSGVGKTALVAALAGSPVPPLHRETLGIEVSTLFWPAVPLGSERPVLFQLRFWDCGESALRKFEHLLPACREEADAILLLFSFTDRASFEELPARLARVLQPGEDTLRVVVGTRFDLCPHTAVTESDVAAFEDSWGLRVLRAGGSGVGRGGLARVAPLLDALVGQLWQRDQMAAGVIPEGQGAPED
ncbi:ciliogenesis and planar polarity effector 2 [Lagopus muta]|uniref:LOW QUALITY PROTEIN: ciliogenesis and planar polarity effector 2 n=1 Tax=Lagopus leucura TaxID=30410 RepID=UPI001C66CBD7|nr:LOW QUALITY PROTEIN: ciliogenesis and planar polarity effector 2 [Lagopus leucura]XP_048823691.1 ciliogenesis and planar polarity effector 2 [Lagopus muta]